ncbi:MAG: hypothetical protein KF704_12340 [Crocinitomicaceae bacterium]|nr:hypothetical protein [Crocinitomicaceae bacterium]
MIKIKKDILDNCCGIHQSELVGKLFQKSQLLKKMISKLIETRNDIQLFKDWFNDETEDFNKKQITVNFALKTGKKIRSLNDLNNLNEQENLDVELSDQTKDTIASIVDFLTEEKVESILKETPHNLNELNTDFIEITRTYDQDLVKKILEFILDYEGFTEKAKDEVYDAYKLTENLEVEACLYCNRNFIQTVSNGDSKLIRPELDHFFPKKDYPLLRLSFYNLIPSCHICNSNLKGSDDFDHEKAFHPYLGSFDDYSVYFTYKPNNVNAFTNPEYKDFVIRVNYDNLSNVKMKARIKKNVECFRLDEIYNYNKSYAIDLKEIFDITNGNYIRGIREKIMVDDKNESIYKSEEEVYRKVIMNYYDPEDFYKRPMAKFIKDLMVDFKLINRTK